MRLSRRIKGTGTVDLTVSLPPNVRDILDRVSSSSRLSRSYIISSLLAAVDERMLIEDLLEISSNRHLNNLISAHKTKPY